MSSNEILSKLFDIPKLNRLPLTSLDSNSLVSEPSSSNLGTQYPLEFQDLKMIGSGSFGSVFKARSTSNQLLYAIKTVSQHNDEGETRDEMIMNEINLMKDLSHPGIIRYYDFYLKNSIYHIILELAEGGNLRQKLGRDPLSENQAKIYTLEVAKALDYLHSKQIIHRDVKLLNVLLTFDDQIKLADFGLSTKTSSGFAFGSCGTPYAKSPELIIGEKYTNSVDWWALGVMLYELVTCEKPFTQMGIQTLEESIRFEEIYFPDSISINCSEVINGLLNKDLDIRLKSLDEILVTNFFKEEEEDEFGEFTTGVDDFRFHK